jgi:hypothetical protein
MFKDKVEYLKEKLDSKSTFTEDDLINLYCLANNQNQVIQGFK